MRGVPSSKPSHAQAYLFHHVDDTMPCRDRHVIVAINDRGRRSSMAAYYDGDNFIDALGSKIKHVEYWGQVPHHPEHKTW